jgi:hypothetical protein
MTTFILLEQGVLSPRDKISDLPNPEHTATYLQSGGAAPNCKHPYSMLTGTQYQTSYLHNILPHSNKMEGVKVKTNGRDFDSSGEATVRRSAKIYCS